MLERDKMAEILRILISNEQNVSQVFKMHASKS